MTQSGEINVALIGYAFMGRAHSNAYRQVTPFLKPRLRPRMKVLCGRTRPNVEAAAKELGWEEVSASWEEVIARKDIHLVDIATPGDSHAEIAIAAAEAGKTVFCEKPLANSLADAERMLAAVEKAGVTHMICHNYRRAPAVMLARDLISRGELGDIRHYRGTYLQDWITDPKFPLVWRLDRTKAGSGALGDIAAHSIDLARFLVGEIAEVAGHLETFVKERPLPGHADRTGRVTVDDAATALVRFENGAMGTIEATRMAPGRKNYNRFEINGSMVTEPEHPYIKAWWPPGHIIGYEHTFVHTVYELLEAMADRRVPSPSFVDGVRNQRVLDAVEKAAQTRAWVSV
jgi:predicted dehydrogenase